MANRKLLECRVENAVVPLEELHNQYTQEKQEKLSLVVKYLKGYLAYIRYGRMAKLKAGQKYFDALRAKYIVQSPCPIIFSRKSKKKNYVFKKQKEEERLKREKEEQERKERERIENEYLRLANERKSTRFVWNNKYIGGERRSGYAAGTLMAAFNKSKGTLLEVLFFNIEGKEIINISVHPRSKFFWIEFLGQSKRGSDAINSTAALRNSRQKRQSFLIGSIGVVIELKF